MPEPLAPPPPPPPGDEAAEAVAAVEAAEAREGEPQDRFRTRVAIAIAVVSILGAVVAFTGTLAGQSATELDQSGIEDTSTQQQVITNLSGTVDEDLRNLAPYQEDLKAADILQSQAATLDNTDPSAAAQLRAQAQSYKVLARTREQFFRGAIPAPGASGAPVQYDPVATLHRLEAENEQLSELRPDATLAQADAKHAQGVNLVGLVTLFIAALLFLTLAQFTRPAIRRLFAAAGGATALVALVLWIVVLVTGG
ncbi:MAG: hypothetical protein JOZ46_12240 [Candidatus Dormibacteraeota bacterium]|nr:hypothetical protein [Candidatus Dormibacteraeota bacterium]MBV9526570.1 hypothetical protein [Candidatus Dormibacteraeota bacterium]